MYKQQKLDFITQMACDFFEGYAEGLSIDIVDDATKTWTVGVVSPLYPAETFKVIFEEDGYIFELARYYKQNVPNISIMQHLRQAIADTTDIKFIAVD